MATFEQHNILLVDAGATIETDYDGKIQGGIIINEEGSTE